MLDLLSKTWRFLLIPLVALALFLGLYFSYYRGSYDPPPRVEIPFEEIGVPISSFGTFTEQAPVQSGTLLVDGVHGNDFTKGEISVLLSRVADRGYDIEFIGEAGPFGGFRSLRLGERLPLLEAKLRQVNSFAVILPEDPYVRQEVDIIERFVNKGGKLLLIADPTRDHEINSLAERFGIAFQPDYLWNQVENDLNFQNVFIRNFRPDQLTNGLGEIVLYTAGSIQTSEVGLALADHNTRSSMVERTEPLSPIVKAGDGRVLAVYDLTFMIPPQNSIMDNDRLVSNIADYLTEGQKQFELADFPHFFKGDVDILLGRADIFDVGTEVKSMLSGFQLTSNVRGVEDLTRDSVFVGLYDDSSDVAQYLEVAGIQVSVAGPGGGTVRTPFTPDISLVGTGIIMLDTTKDRHVLVVLGDSKGTLLDMVRRLESGRFRSGLVSEFLGVYRSF